MFQITSGTSQTVSGIQNFERNVPNTTHKNVPDNSLLLGTLFLLAFPVFRRICKFAFKYFFKSPVISLMLSTSSAASSLAPPVDMTNFGVDFSIYEILGRDNLEDCLVGKEITASSLVWLHSCLPYCVVKRRHYFRLLRDALLMPRSTLPATTFITVMDYAAQHGI